LFGPRGIDYPGGRLAYFPARPAPMRVRHFHFPAFFPPKNVPCEFPLPAGTDGLVPFGRHGNPRSPQQSGRRRSAWRGLPSRGRKNDRTGNIFYQGISRKPCRGRTAPPAILVSWRSFNGPRMRRGIGVPWPTSPWRDGGVLDPHGSVPPSERRSIQLGYSFLHRGGETPLKFPRALGLGEDPAPALDRPNRAFPKRRSGRGPYGPRCRLAPRGP